MTAKKMIIIVLSGLAMLVLLLAPFSASPLAEEEGEYPHGDFEEDCSMCHKPERWTPAEVGPEFKHDKRWFPLDGSHAQTECRACHLSLDFSQADSACASCHPDVHLSELGADCGRCHSSRSFIDRSGMIRAHQSYRFPLRGAHRTIDCDECHPPVAQGGMQYVQTPTDCNACHLNDYFGTIDPDHQAGDYPRTCENCHSTGSWRPAGFNHSTLTRGIQCATCHLDDYQSSTDPDHQAAGYPQECELCHSTRRWVPAAFDGLSHDGQFFPIFSGRHRGDWTACSDCHTTPNNFSQFSCIDCHRHDDPQESARQHEGESGYLYESEACYNCHPQGDEE
jgi:hypothetical protein